MTMDHVVPFGHLGRAVWVGGLIVLAGCGSGPREIEDPQAALEPIFMTMRGFHIKNEIYYAEHGRYADDVEALAAEYDFRRDSVNLEVFVTEEGQGMSSIGTHQRLGPDVGCAFVWGDAPMPTTPGGRTHDGANHFVCDAPFDGVESTYPIADPPD